MWLLRHPIRGKNAPSARFSNAPSIVSSCPEERYRQKFEFYEVFWRSTSKFKQNKTIEAEGGILSRWLRMSNPLGPAQRKVSKEEPDRDMNPLMKSPPPVGVALVTTTFTSVVDAWRPQTSPEDATVRWRGCLKTYLRIPHTYIQETHPHYAHLVYIQVFSYNTR